MASLGGVLFGYDLGIKKLRCIRYLVELLCRNLAILMKLKAKSKSEQGMDNFHQIKFRPKASKNEMSVGLEKTS